jgi:hypothetical protein
MVYALFELAFVLMLVGIVTAPFWAKGMIGWMTRPFGTPSEADLRRDGEDDHD